MKKIKFLNKSYNIPTSWKEITLEQQIMVSQIASEQQYVKTIAILAGYTGIPLELLKTAKTHQLVKVMKALEFIDKPISTEPILTFELSGHTYQVGQSILEMEFQDYVAIQTSIAEHENNQWNMTPYIVAIMAKKDNETLDDYDIRERAELMKQLDVETCNGITAFFLNSLQVSNFIMTYSSPEVQKEIVQSKLKELNSSINKLRKQRGGNLLIRLWTMILRKYTKYLSKSVEKYFNTQASEPSRTRWNMICRKLRFKKLRNKKPH